MKKGLTELVFILDRSGSMSGLEGDTVGGYNSMLEKQRKEEGECLVSTVLFNSTSQVICDRQDIKKVRNMEARDYFPSGCTALIDALGDAIKHIKTVHRYIREEDVPEHTLFVITTDGYENASHKYSSAEVKKMVSAQKEAGWQFLFLGANIDAVETARSYGIDDDKSVNYVNDGLGHQRNFRVLSKTITAYRTTGCIDESWKQEIEEDYANRK